MERPFGLPGRGLGPRFEARDALGWLPRGYIDGLTLANDTTDATNDISVQPGVCRSTTAVVDGVGSNLSRDQIDLEIPVAILKQLDVAWAPANYDLDPTATTTRSGGRSSSSIGNGTWNVFVLGGRDVPSDVVLHDATTFTHSTLPAMFSAWRMIGSVLRESGTIVPFTQANDYFLRNTLSVEINTTPANTTANSLTIKVPTGIRLRAHLQVSLLVNATGYVLVSDLSATDETPAASLCTAGGIIDGGEGRDTDSADVGVHTNSSAQVRYRASTTSNSLAIATRGWWHPRGRDAV